MDAEHTFRTLVDASKTQFNGALDLAASYRALGLTPAREGAFSSTELKDFFQQTMREALSAKKAHVAILKIPLRGLRDQLVIRQAIDHVPAEPYLSVLEEILDSVESSSDPLVDFSESTSWAVALKAARDSLFIAGTKQIRLPSYAYEFDRQLAVGGAIVRLREAGYPCTVLDGRADMSLEDQKRLCDDIVELVRKLGGLRVAQWVFFNLSELYCPSQSRYHIRAQGKRRGMRPSVPFGYLLNLAARFPNAPAISDEEVRSMGERMKCLATDYVCLYDIEGSDPSTVISASVEELLFEMTRALRYKRIVGFPQARPADMVELLQGVFDWISDRDAAELLGGSIREVATVLNFLVNRAPHARGQARKLTVDFVARRLTMIERPRIESIMNTFAHSAANKLYVSPDELHLVDVGKKPLLRDGDEYIVFAPSWAAPGMLEAARIAIDQGMPWVNCSERIGDAFETTVRSTLNAKAVVALTGKYRAALDSKKKQTFDVDVAVETDEAVILFELKKRTLSNTASSDDIELLLSVARSLFESQIQLARHELVLRAKGKIELVHDGKAVTVALAERRIERVSLSLTDFGPVQDHVFFRRALEVFAGRSLKLIAPEKITPEKRQKFTEVERLCVALGEIEDKVASLRPQPATFFSNCWFMSYGELKVRLDHVVDSNSLLRELLVGDRVTTGSQDPYYEYAFLKGAETSAK